MTANNSVFSLPAVSVLIKPASSLCNLRCKYCFYHDVSAHRETASFGRMSFDTSHILIKRVFEAAERGGVVNFSFQGGEPTVAGLDFFVDFALFAEKHNDKNLTLNYAIQTNGTLLDGKWCRFLAKYRFLVGLSLDGDETLHNENRVFASGGGSFDTVKNASEMLRRYSVDFNILSVITEQTANSPAALFDFYEKHGYDFVQLIPCLLPLDFTTTEENPPPPYALRADTYARFLCEMFRLWSKKLLRGEAMSIRLFDNVVGMYLGRLPEQCGVYGRCVNQLVIEADGRVFPCDFYCLDEYAVGNIKDDDIEKLMTGEAARRYLSETVPVGERCAECAYFKMCAGGCRRYRQFYSSIPGFCPYEEFLRRCAPEISALVEYFGK